MPRRSVLGRHTAQIGLGKTEENQPARFFQVFAHALAGQFRIAAHYSIEQDLVQGVFFRSSFGRAFPDDLRTL